MIPIIAQVRKTDLTATSSNNEEPRTAPSETHMDNLREVEMELDDGMLNLEWMEDKGNKQKTSDIEEVRKRIRVLQEEMKELTEAIKEVAKEQMELDILTEDYSKRVEALQERRSHDGGR
jgi:predicted RNase H-like nuclease (RuvC/YqgF family)